MTPYDWNQVVRCRNTQTRYAMGDLVGKDITQVGKASGGKEFVASDSQSYDRWMQAIGSASELLAKATGTFKRGKPKIIAVVPILVVPDGMLWRAEYSAEGHLIEAPARVDQVAYFIDRDMGQRHGVYIRVSHLEIMTLSGLLQFVEEPRPDQEHSLFPMEFMRESYHYDWQGQLDLEQ